MKLNPCREKWVRPLVDEAADRFMVTPGEVLSKTKLRTVCHARMYAIWLARSRFGWSYPELALVFGLDNTTCRNACIETEKRLGAPSVAKAVPIRDTLPSPAMTEAELVALDERFA